MNIDHMRAFLEVAATGSFQLASQRLNVTQSTVSARIKVLEQRLGCVLFDRRSSGADPTMAGRQFHRYAATAVQAWEQARHDIVLPETLSSVVGLGIQTALWERVGYEWIQRIQSRAPELGVRTVVDYSEPLTRFLCDGFLDVAIIYVPQKRPNLTVQRLMEEKLILVSGTRDRELDASWSEDYIYVDWGDDFRHQHALAFPEARTSKLQIDHPSLAFHFVLGRGCSAYLLESSVRAHLERGDLHRVPGAPEFSCPTYIAYPNDPIQPERLTVAIEELHRLIAPG